MIVNMGKAYSPLENAEDEPDGNTPNNCRGHYLTATGRGQPDNFPVNCEYCKQTYKGVVVKIISKVSPSGKPYEEGEVLVDINEDCCEGIVNTLEETVQDVVKQLVGAKS